MDIFIVFFLVHKTWQYLNLVTVESVDGNTCDKDLEGNFEEMLQRTEKESLDLLAGMVDGWREAQVKSPSCSGSF